MHAVQQFLAKNQKPRVTDIDDTRRITPKHSSHILNFYITAHLLNLELQAALSSQSRPLTDCDHVELIERQVAIANRISRLVVFGLFAQDCYRKCSAAFQDVVTRRFKETLLQLDIGVYYPYFRVPDFLLIAVA